MKNHSLKKWLLPLLTAAMLFSSNAFSQITLKMEKANLKQVLRTIENKTGYRFVYEENAINFPVIAVDLKNVSLEKALQTIFQQTDIQYRIVKKNILLKSQRGNSSNRSSTLLNVNNFQSYEISGKIIGANGQALQGATVKIKGTQVAASTDANGFYKIESDQSEVVLQISYLGYQSLEIDAKGNMGTIALISTEAALSEVEINVNTGYQSIPKERATGAFASLPKKSLDQQRLNDLSTLLEGRIAGYHDGQIRGTTSMNGITNPLYVVDGFPIENNNIAYNGNIQEVIPSLNLEDIESITVLKDAAAASIYGARAANGVIVIVTKKGKTNGVEINASATITHTPYKFFQERLTSSADIIDIEREWAMRNPRLDTLSASGAQKWLDEMLYQSRGIQTILQRYAGKISESEMNERLDDYANNGYRYYDDVEKYGKRNPLAQQYNINLASGNDKNQFYGSVTYKRDLMEDIYSNNNNLGINLNNNVIINKWLSLELSTFLNYGIQQKQSYDLMSPQFSYLPYDGLMNADGSPFISTAASRLSLTALNIIRNNKLHAMDINPLDEIDNNLEKSKRFSNRSYVKLNIKLADWINYSGSFQYEYERNNNELLYDKNSFYVRNRINGFARSINGEVKFMLPYGNIFNTGQVDVNNYNFRQQINIDKSFNNDHHLNAIAGTEIRSIHSLRKNQTLYNYDPLVLTYESITPGLSSGGNIMGTYASFDQRSDVFGIFDYEKRFVSLYSNVGYSFKDRYLLSGSLRWDRSNLWGTSSKYQNKPIWSIGAGWNIEKEEFFSIAWINQLKLRTSYGIGGNISHDAGPFMTAYYSINPNVGGNKGTIGSRPNPLLSWEKTTTINVGTDFSLFNNRLFGSIDYYRKKGEDLLASAQGVPTEGFGYSTYDLNNGGMTNHGIETSLAATVLKTGKFNWNSNILHAYNKNKVTYVDVEAPVYFLQLDYPNAFPRVGNPYQSVYAFGWAGLNGEGLPQVYNENTEKVSHTPGTLDAVIYAGTTVPYHTFSWTNSLSYGNFDFSMMMTYQAGHRIRNTNLPYLGGSSQYANIRVTNVEIADRWKNPGDEQSTNVPRLIFPEEKLYNSQSETIYRYADINVLDASNLHIRNISLAYRIPAAFLKNIKIPQARIQFNAEHVALFAKSKNAKQMLGGYRSPNYVFGIYVSL